MKHKPKPILTFIGLVILVLLSIIYVVTASTDGAGKGWVYVLGLRSESDAVRRFQAYNPLFVPIGSRTYKLYIADTDEKRTHGLSDVESMSSFEGMAFVFPQADMHSFWMKDMQFPLDFIYVADRIVVDLIEDVQPDSYPSTIQAKAPADTVIELNAGQIKKNGIRIGDPLTLD